jgi:hypothetical protein
MEFATNKVFLLIGRRNTGKTFTMKQLAAAQRLNKVLVVDTIIHPAYNELCGAPVPLEHLPFWKPKKQGKSYARVLFESVDDLSIISQEVTNTCIIFEDATKILHGSTPDSMIKILADSKQRNNDIWLLFHSLATVPPRLFQFADGLVLKKTSETEKALRSLDKIPEAPAVIAAYNALHDLPNEPPHQYAYKFIQFT